MAYDPNFNSSGACKNPMTSEASSTDFDWYTNEESFDLTSFMSSSGNLELCNDDLFQNLFPSESSELGADPKNDDLSYLDDDEVENWYQSATSEPASACTSAAPSPVPLNYYNTPPVTPQSERHRPSSPHHLQLDGLTTPMSSSRFSSLRTEEGNGSFFPLRQPDGQNQHVLIKQEPETDGLTIYPPQASIQKEQKISIKKEQPNSVPSSSVTKCHVDTSNPTVPAKQLVKRSSPLNPAPVEAKKSKMLVKGTNEYLQKRHRNNVAVRRSRDKAKMKALETQKKVDELSSENEQLHARVAELTNELTTLKSLLRDMPNMKS